MTKDKSKEVNNLIIRHLCNDAVNSQNNDIVLVQNDDINKIIEKIKYTRKLCKIKQSELGDAVGCSRQAIGQIENGNTFPRYNLLKKILRALDIKVEVKVNFELKDND